MTTLYSRAQSLSLKTLSLPAEIAYYDNQVSGLYIYDKKLWLMSESRLQDNAAAILFTIELQDLDKKLSDSSYTLPYKKISIEGIEALRNKLDAGGDKYEGLEALVIKGDEVWFSVETNKPSPNDALFHGVIKNGRIILGGEPVILPKQTGSDGRPVYNAGFESLLPWKDGVLAVYEYNRFRQGAQAYYVAGTKIQDSMAFPAIPFRITDITHTKGKKYLAINYFFQGNGGDAAYRVPADDPDYSKVFDTAWHSYSRILTLKIKKKKISWKPFGELPNDYWQYNWEGIAAHKNGFFIVNDKYTSKKPYATVLAFVTK